MDVNARDKYLQTPLHYAVETGNSVYSWIDKRFKRTFSGNVQIVIMLIRASSDPMAMDKFDRRPQDLAAQSPGEHANSYQDLGLMGALNGAFVTWAEGGELLFPQLENVSVLFGVG